MSKFEYLFPTFTKEELLERVQKKWDLTQQLPIPKFKPICSVCGSDEILTRQWTFHDRTQKTKSKHGYRCDVSFKCTECSYVWVHGVVVTWEMFDKYKNNRLIHWRTAKKILG